MIIDFNNLRNHHPVIRALNELDINGQPVGEDDDKTDYTANDEDTPAEPAEDTAPAADDAPTDYTAEEEPADEEVSVDPQPSETIEDEQVPEAGKEKTSFPVVPVAAASVIIVAGVGVTLAGKFGLLAKLLRK
jgi:cell division protein FtsN